MNRAAKITTAVSALAVAGLAVPAFSTIGTVVSSVIPAPSSTPPVSTAETSVPQGGQFAGNCGQNSRIEVSSSDGAAPLSGRLIGPDLVDMGASDTASGTPISAGGRIVSYTVAEGDTLVGIGERFCIDYMTVSLYNNVPAYDRIAAGDRLTLHPDPAIEWESSRAT